MKNNNLEPRENDHLIRSRASDKNQNEIKKDIKKSNNLSEENNKENENFGRNNKQEIEQKMINFEESKEHYEEADELSDVANDFNSNSNKALDIKMKKIKIQTRKKPKNQKEKKSFKSDFSPEYLYLKQKHLHSTSKSNNSNLNVKEDLSRFSYLSNFEKRSKHSKMQNQKLESTKDLFIDTLKNSSRIRDKYIAAKLELKQIKDELILERKTNYELEQAYHKLVNHFESKKILYEELSLLKESYYQLQISFEKSEEIRQFQKKLIKNLQTEIDSLNKPLAKIKSKSKVKKKGKSTN